MHTKGNLAAADSLLPSAEEKRDIRGAGADIQDHKAAPGVFRSAEAEISSQGSAFRGKGDQRLFLRDRETGGFVDFPGQRDKQFPEFLPACFSHLIRNGKTPEDGGKPVRTRLQRGHQHDLMKTEHDGTPLFLFPFQAGIEGAGGNGKHVLKRGGYQHDAVLKWQRRGAWNVSEDPGRGRKKRGNRNRRQKLAVKQIPGRSRVINQRAHHGGALKRFPVMPGGKYDGGTD